MKYLIQYGSIEKKVTANSEQEALDKLARLLGYKNAAEFKWYDRSGVSIKPVALYQDRKSIQS